MAYGKAFEALMAMDDATWARHSNPWSGWTRVAILPLLTLAIWSRIWIGGWALLPCALVAIWIWLNPRVFPPPATKTHWMTKGVLGEKLWLDAPKGTLPRHHLLAANILNAVAGLAVIPYVWGLWTLSVWPTLFGMGVSMLAKLWFLDRMVWLHDELSAGQTPER